MLEERASSPPAPSGGDTPKVAFFHSYWTLGASIALGASDYWRLALPAAELYRHGWDVILARCIAAGDDGRIVVQDPRGEWHDDRDVIVMGQWMSEGTAERIVAAREAGQAIVQDVDDNYWGLPKDHVAFDGTDPEKRPGYNRDHYREVIAASTLATVSTPAVARLVEPFGAPVTLVRNYVDRDAWGLRSAGDHVGFIGMLQFRDDDLGLMRETVVPWLRERDRFFYHGGDVGDPTISAERALGYDRVTTRPSCPIERYPLLWDPVRVLLVPIRDSAFNRHRSWTKGLEACSAGRPFVASDHAEYWSLGAGRIAKTPEDWVRHLEALEDPAVWEEDVEANRARAEQLTIQEHWTEWADVLRGVTLCVS